MGLCRVAVLFRRSRCCGRGRIGFFPSGIFIVPPDISGWAHRQGSSCGGRHEFPELCPAPVSRCDEADLFQRGDGHQRPTGVLLAEFCKQGLQVFGVPVPRLQLPINGDDMAALRGDALLLLRRQGRTPRSACTSAACSAAVLPRPAGCSSMMRPDSCAPRGES